MLGNTASEVGRNTTSIISTLENLWIVGVLLASIIFGFKLLKIFRLSVSSKNERIHETELKLLPKTDLAFSFFNTIYVGENISVENRSSIIAHEKVHIRQKHSIDLLYFELLRIVFWFNPLVYMFQNRIATLHEYIADSEITRNKDKKKYYQNLLSEVFQTEQISFVNTFFKQSLIKKRIIMLQKSKSSKTAQFKYILILPIVLVMLTYTSCSNDLKTGESQTFEKSEAEVMSEIKAKEEEKIRLYSENLKDEVNLTSPLPPTPPIPPTVPANRESKVLEIDTIIGGNEVGAVPYAVIDQVPTYPGCTGNNETMKICMSTKIAEFVNRNFNTKVIDNLKLSGRQRVAVQFTIDKTGKAVDVRATAKIPELENEAVRVVKMLPQMKPGEQNGEKVWVLYSLPIVFDVVE